jgi:hypothetical protein
VRLYVKERVAWDGRLPSTDIDAADWMQDDSLAQTACKKKGCSVVLVLPIFKSQETFFFAAIFGYRKQFTGKPEPKNPIA